MLEFSLPTNELSLSTIFSNLQEAKTLLQLQDFSVSQTTLDQVFVGFANEQVNDFQHDHPSAEPTASTGGYTNAGFVSSSTKNLSSNISSKPAAHKQQAPAKPIKSTPTKSEISVAPPPPPAVRLPPPMPMPMHVRQSEHKAIVARAKSMAAKTHAHRPEYRLDRRGPAMRANSTVGNLHQQHYLWKAHHINTKMTRF